MLRVVPNNGYSRGLKEQAAIKREGQLYRNASNEK